MSDRDILASGPTDAPLARPVCDLRWAVCATLLGCVPFGMWFAYLGWATGSPVRDLFELPPLWLALTAVPLLAGAGSVSLAVRSQWSSGDYRTVGENSRWTMVACIVATCLGLIWVVLLACFLGAVIYGDLAFS